jgi:tetratricopeptide (TPR) repeat protein
MSRLPGLDQIERRVMLNRRKGDALVARDNRDGALEAYRTAIKLAEEALRLIGVPSDADSAIDDDVASDAAEWFGIRGGLLRRVGELGEDGALDEALRSYRRGAEIEAACKLPATYNRANAVKLALINGEATLEGERDNLLALRDVLEDRLASDEHAADDAWLWADLGDATLLLGEQSRAVSAYTTFAEKARTDTPATTLNVLRTLVTTLKARNDHGAPPVEAALDRIEALFESR